MLEGWGKATGLIPTFYRPTHNVAGNSPERHTHTKPSDYTFFSPFHPNPSIWNLDELLLWHLLGLISYLCSWHALFLYILVESLRVHFGANGAWIKADISISLSYRLFYYSSFQRHFKKKKKGRRDHRHSSWLSGEIFPISYVKRDLDSESQGYSATATAITRKTAYLCLSSLKIRETKNREK